MAGWASTGAEGADGQWRIMKSANRKKFGRIVHFLIHTHEANYVGSSIRNIFSPCFQERHCLITYIFFVAAVFLFTPSSDIHPSAGPSQHCPPVRRTAVDGA